MIAMVPGPTSRSCAGCRGAGRLRTVALSLLLGAAFLSLVGCPDTFIPAPDVTITDVYVDLRPRQSSLKNQGQRTTCIVFAAVAALEAAYIRIGYGELDLSEEFINFARKAFYLEPQWSVVESRGPDARETQLGSSGGGGGVGVVAKLNMGFMVPLESVMPYQAHPTYYESNYPHLAEILARRDAGEELTQRDLSDFNLDPTILTRAVLRADTFYSVHSYVELSDPRSTTQIEDALKGGFEVVWDFSGANPAAPGVRDGRGVWQACASCPRIAHSMLIVGFDRRHPDPREHYFIVKNTWGSAATVAGEGGYTLISYDYVRQYGLAAAYILLAAPPRPWPELAFIGRWNISYDGHRGELDIYHLPGMAERIFRFNFAAGNIPEVYDDYRLGTFYDSQGNAYKVNGHVSGNFIEFYIDLNRPNIRWDELTGRRFRYYLDDDDFMAGYHRDGDLSQWGGYATKGEFLPGGALTPRPFFGSSYLGSRWTFASAEHRGVLEFTAYAGPGSNQYDLLEGTYMPDGSSAKYPAQIQVLFDPANRTNMQIANMGDGSVRSFVGRHLSWEPGLVVGDSAVPDTGTRYPYSMTRLPD